MTKLILKLDTMQKSRMTTKQKDRIVEILIWTRAFNTKLS